ncbi:MlaD family protein [bacterium]|jgi:phospholipid/cholesterol/gamma-HCH transport system substrate-binding protein|nr:MlaD family protein [bacterium]MDB4641060.1 MlaD family protein [Pirellulaceae bacterium]MDB4650561.1 MlaD family protein [Pirellulaceae bacterium]
MENKALLWWLGVTVLATMLMAATLILYFGRGFQPSYVLNIICDRAPNITPETPVKRNGVLIGRVDDVTTLDDGGVKLVLKINKGVRLFSNEVASIGMTSILGESVIEFVPGRGNGNGVLLKNGQQLSSDSVEVMIGPSDILKEVPMMLQRFDDLTAVLKKAATSVETTSDQIGAFVQDVKGGLGEDGQKKVGEFLTKMDKMAGQAEKALDTYSAIGTKILGITEDKELEASMKKILEDLPSLLDRTNEMMIRLNKPGGAIAEFEKVGVKANETLSEISILTKSLRDEEFLQSLKDSLDGVGQFLTNIKDSKGTLGLLLNDPSVYNRLDNSLRKVESITFQLEPILNDVRVFTSKIATDPRQLGVKGALDRTPSGTGTKGAFLRRQGYAPNDYFGRDVYED